MLMKGSREPPLRPFPSLSAGLSLSCRLSWMMACLDEVVLWG
jgi:hypothetical protein